MNSNSVIARMILVAMAMFLSACSAGPDTGEAVPPEPVEIGAPQLDVTVASMSELLGDPQLFDGKRVRVIGVADFQFGLLSGSYLYLSKEHRRNWTNEAVRLVGLEEAFPEDLGLLPELNAEYVVVEGMFHYTRLKPGDTKGREGQIDACVLSCNGELSDINRISMWGMESEHRMEKHMH